MTSDGQMVGQKAAGRGTVPGSYCLITPCRDEAQFARRTLDSILRQTHRPALWVIVDDGSTDDTPNILAEYAEQHPFIRIVNRADRGVRSVGPGVMQAFYAGVEAISHEEWHKFEFICKLDLDLDIPEGYFEEIVRRMNDEPRMATCSGSPYFIASDGAVVSEACGEETSVGMIKFYRRSAWEQIGGFIRELTWDAIDCHICRYHGWFARSWDEPAIRFHHLRPMGSSHKSWWTGRVRHGSGQWFMGTSPIYMLVSGGYRMTRPPYVIGGLGMIWGYFKSMATGRPRYADADLRRFLRRYQYACLVLGKKRATARLDRQQYDVWLRGQRGVPVSGAASYAAHAPI